MFLPHSVLFLSCFFLGPEICSDLKFVFFPLEICYWSYQVSSSLPKSLFVLSFVFFTTEICISPLLFLSTSQKLYLSCHVSSSLLKSVFVGASSLTWLTQAPSGDQDLGQGTVGLPRVRQDQASGHSVLHHQAEVPYGVWWVEEPPCPVLGSLASSSSWQ